MSWIRSVTKKNKEERWIENLALREAMTEAEQPRKAYHRTALLRGKTQMK